MRAIFRRYLQYYYYITRPEALGGDYCVYKRYDRSAEDLAYHNLHKKFVSQPIRVKMPKWFFHKPRNPKKGAKKGEPL